MMRPGAKGARHRSESGSEGTARGGLTRLAVLSAFAVLAALLTTVLPARAAAGDSATVSVTAPASVGAGEDIVYQVTVTNTGAGPLTTVDLTDDAIQKPSGVSAGAAVCDPAVPLATLPKGASQIFDCTLATANPANIGTIENTFTVTAPELAAPVVSDQVDVTVEAPAPSMNAAKSVLESTIGVGQDIHYEIVVENTGNVGLTGVTVADADAPGCDVAPTVLAVGEDLTASCTRPSGAVAGATLTNVALADSSETPELLTNVVSTTVEAADPSVQITKTGPASVPFGTPIDYTIEVTNTGNTALTAVTVADANAPACAGLTAGVGTPPGPAGVLLVGQKATKTCSFTPGATGPYTNVASVTSAETPTPVSSETVTTQVVAPGPSVAITKSAAQTSVIWGDEIDYTIEVTNTGNVPLTDVTVTDPNAADCEATPLRVTLPVGETATIDCAYDTGLLANPATSVVRSNVATVDTNETAPAASGEVDVTVQREVFEISATKSAPAAIGAGYDIDYAIEITNTGNRAVDGITVNDPNAPDCSGPVPAPLDPGDSTVVTCSVATTDPGDIGDTIHNVATVDTAQTTPKATNEVTTTVEAPDPALTITKVADQTEVDAGTAIDYHLTVENTGNVPLTGITTVDANAPDCDAAVPDLAPGEDHTVDCAYTTTYPDDLGTYTNVAQADSAETDAVDSNEVDVTVSAPVWPPSGLTDVPAWVTDAVNWLVANNYATGYPDNTFRPNKDITRGEVARMVFRIAGSPGGSPPNTFPDVPDWLDAAVDWMEANGYMTGYRDGTFRPDRPITRGEVSRLVFRVAGSPGGSPPNGYPDVPNWLDPAVDWLKANNYVSGYSDGTYRPKLNITRAQVANILYNVNGP